MQTLRFHPGGLLSIRLHRHSGRSGAGILIGGLSDCEELVGVTNRGRWGESSISDSRAECGFFSCGSQIQL